MMMFRIKTWFEWEAYLVQPDLVHGGQLRTDWGERTAGLSFEFYPQLDRDADFVHSRFYIDRFYHRANGWTYSAEVGRITLTTLADPGTAAISRTVPESAPSRMPNLGYGRPGFTSPEGGSGARPSFTSPDFTSPDFGGPEHRPE